MFRFKLLIGLFLAFTGGVFAQTANDAFIKGNELFKLKKYVEAEQAYTECIRLNPKISNCFFNRGLARQIGIGYAQALEDFTQVISLEPNNAKAYKSRGVVFVALKRFDEAIADFNKAISLDAKYAEAYYQRGITYEKKGDETQAVADITQAIANDSRKGYMYSSRGMIYKKQKNFDLAIKDFSNAVTWNPNDGNSFYHRGEIYFDQGKLELAEINFNLAITIDKSYQRLVDSHKLLAKINATQNQGKQPETNLPKPANIQPTPSPKYNPVTPPLTSVEKEKVATEHLNNAIYNFRGNKFEAAAADFTKYLQVYPNSAEGYYNRGLTFAKWGKSASAIADFEQALKLKPDFAKAKTELDKLKQTKTEEIVTSISQISDVKPTDEFYGDLQSLIEKYGISKVTKDKKFNPNNNLTMFEYADFIKQGKEYLKNSAGGFGVKRIDEEKLFNSKCTLPYLEMIPEKEIAKSLSCNYRIKNFSMSGGDNWVTRGKFAIYFNKAIQQAALELMLNSQAENVSNDVLSATAKQPDDEDEMNDENQPPEESKYYKEALADLNKCLKKKKGNTCYYERAVADNFKEDYTSALKNINLALKAEPRQWKYIYFRADLYRYELNDNQKAWDDFSALIRLQPKSALWYSLRASVACKIPKLKTTAKQDEANAVKLGLKIISPCK